MAGRDTPTLVTEEDVAVAAGMQRHSEIRQGSTPENKPLSCTNCRQRKIRCDRASPCAACIRSGARCVLPTRVQRRRPRKRPRNAEILRRLGDVEAILKSMGRDTTTPSSDSHSSIYGDLERANLFPAQAASTRTALKGKDFVDDVWAHVGGEVHGLRSLTGRPLNSHDGEYNDDDDDDTNDDDDDDDDEGDEEDEAVESSLMSISPTGHSLSMDLVFPEAQTATDQSEAPIAHSHLKSLINVYFANVDPTFKILHKPSTLAVLGISTGNFSTSPDNGVTQLLALCIQFAAVASLSPKACWQLCNEDSQILLARLGRALHRAFARENLLDTSDLVVLQAFTIYLGALRGQSKSNSTWTLFAVALRIAQSFKLYKHPSATDFSFFECQQRRLLWWQILTLDIRFAEDRGSQPMIFEGSFDTRMPLNVNDDDYGPDTRHTIPESPGLTDMTQSHVTHRLASTFRKFLFPGEMTIVQKEQMVQSLGLELKLRFFEKCDTNNPNQWFLSTTGRLLISKMWLALRYPLHIHGEPLLASPDQTLGTAVSILEIMMDLYEDNPKSLQFKWITQSWVQWHPLAVALVELCNQTSGPLVDRAWAVVGSVWDKFRERITDTKGARLWKAIKKLLKKAKTARQEVARDRDTIDPGHERDELHQVTEDSSVTQPSSGSQIDPQVPEVHGSGKTSDVVPAAQVPAAQNIMRADDGNQFNWEDWQEFLTYSDLLNSTNEDNGFDIWSSALTAS